MLFVLATVIFSAVPIEAVIKRFEVVTQEGFGSYTPWEYIRLTGKITGELMTTEAIPGLAKADKDGDGKVEYSTDFILIIPADLNDSNGVLIFDCENRGRPVAQGLYNNNPGKNRIQLGTLDAGNGFIQENAFRFKSAIRIMRIIWRASQQRRKL